MKIEAPSERTTEFLEKLSVMALKVNTDETASIHFLYPTAAIKPYQKERLKNRPRQPFLWTSFWHYSTPEEFRPGETLSQ